MKANFYKFLGAFLLIASGLFYTAERISARISSAIVAAGFSTHRNVVENIPSYSGLFDNFFVWFLWFVGILILIFGFVKKT